MKHSLLLLFLAILPVMAMADDSGSCGDNVTYNYVESTKTLTISGTGKMKNYDYYNQPWYNYRANIQKLIIENGVTLIGEDAFNSCSSLTSISIPNSVTRINSHAFAYCTGLTSITIPESVEDIYSYAFEGTAWYNNQPNGLVYLGNFVLGYKGSMPANTSLKIKEGTLKIAISAFYNCKNLTSVEIPSSVTRICNNAFGSCNNLTKVIVKDIAEWCNITFVSNPLTYAHHLYSDENTEIIHLVIPQNVQNINAYAFSGCTDLQSVTFESGDVNFNTNAFSDCNVPIYYIPKGSLATLKSGLRTTSSTRIYEMEGDKVWSETIFGVPNDFTTYYDCDGDGVMEYLSASTQKEDNYTTFTYGFFNKNGKMMSELGSKRYYSSGSTFKYPYATIMNGKGDLQLCWESSLISVDGDPYRDGHAKYSLLTDIDNDGRKDLVTRYQSDDKFTIHYQQSDGSFKAIEQSAVMDEEATKAAANKGGGGIVSFADGMMVKAPKRKPSSSNRAVEFAGGSSVEIGSCTAIDMNDDGILDIMNNGAPVLYSYDDNRYFRGTRNRSLHPCDLDGDGELDYVCYDGSSIILQVRESGTEFTEKTLFTNSNVKQIIYKDFDHDGDIDILAYINENYRRGNSDASGNTYFVFFRNDGDMSFKRRERNFGIDYELLDIKDVDADGLYEMVVIDYTNKVKKILRISENLTVTESDYDMSDCKDEHGNYVYDYDKPIVIGDFDNDGKVDFRYLVRFGFYGDYGSKYGIFSDAVNTAPNKMEAPTAVLDAEAQRLRINWNQGTDKETSSCDLTYELRIGTEPASGNVLFGASLADGTRRTLEDGNMGHSLSTLFNAKSMKPGKYYISVQAIDAGGRGGVWSDDFVYEHQLAAPVIVSNLIDQMSTADTLRLSVKTPIEKAEYKWTVSEGRQIESDGNDVRFIFEQDGKHTVNLAMTYDGRTLNAEPFEIGVEPAKIVSGSSCGYVDFNQDGYPEFLGFVNDGKGNLEEVLLSYATQYSGGNYDKILDFNMDGYPDVMYSSDKVLINLGEQDNDFDVTTEEIDLDNVGTHSGLWFDANNDGYLDTPEGYNNGTNHAWMKYTSTDSKYAMRDNYGNVRNWDYLWQRYNLGSPNYDVNRDGMLDIVTRIDYEYNKRWYVMYKDSTANMSYTAPQLMYETENTAYDWRIEDINNDGYADLLYFNNNTKLVVVKGSATLPYTETITPELPVQRASSYDFVGLYDYNNDGYVDYRYYDSSNKKHALIKFGPDFSMESITGLDEFNNSYRHFMIQKDGGYPDRMESHIKNQSPSAPASVTAKQTKDGMLITWSDAQDDHTPAMQMRYNISVKRKGKKGDNSFVISPMNGLKDKATICGTVMYKKSTQMLVPASVLTAGETYEIQVQAIDLWNQHSPMTKAIEFTMTSNGYIDVAEQVATDKETTVKFVGSQAGSYSLNAGDGATIVSDKGNGEYIVKWTTEGVKEITLTAGNTTVKSSVTVVKPIDLTFTVPATVFAKAPLTIEVSDEMAKAAKNVGLRCNDVNVKIEYVVGSKTANVTFPATGTYTLEAYSTDEVKGNTYSQVVNVTAEMPKAAIKQVDVDAATGSYAISWNAEALPAGISKIIVSKEGSKLGQFDKIETVAATAGRYVDLSSNASVMASRYCIQLVAENGQVSEVSSAHKPLHVMITKAAQGFNLIWDSYEGLDVESYNILRGSTPDNLQEIAQVAGSVNSYTDISAPSGVSYYAVTFAATQPQLTRGQKRTKITDETVNSNVISTENAIDVVVAERLEIIVLDEEKELTDDHTDLQLYYMILPTYTTINKVTWEIVDGKDIATIDANGKLHATGGDGMVVVRVKTIDGSNLTDEISVNCAVTNQSTGISQISVTTDTDATLKETRYYTMDGKRIESPIAGQMYVEWSIYSNGQIVTRKLFKK